MSPSKSHKKAVIKKESYVEFIRDSVHCRKHSSVSENTSPPSQTHPHKNKKYKTSPSAIITIPPPEKGILFKELRSSYFDDFEFSTNILTIIDHS